MEDILAVILFFVAASITGLFIRHLLKTHAAKVAAEQKRQEVEAELKAEQVRAREKLRRDAQAARAAMAASNTPPPKTLNTVAAKENVGRSTYVPTHATSPTQSVQSDDGFVNGMLTGMLVDNLINSMPHKSGGSNPIDFPREERSVGVSKSESSWGFDDSDSRKSVSSSMDTSSSYSSSSSDSSSSWSSSDSSSSVSSDW